MRWENRCPFVILANVNGRLQVIDQCRWESGHTEPHWSKQHDERADWVDRSKQEKN